jgi:nucleoside-diphosphate kinase
MNERTYIMIKPSGVERGLVGEIIKRFEQKGLRLNGLKMIQVIVIIY